MFNSTVRQNHGRPKIETHVKSVYLAEKHTKSWLLVTSISPRSALLHEIYQFQLKPSQIIEGGTSQYYPSELRRMQSKVHSNKRRETNFRSAQTYCLESNNKRAEHGWNRIFEEYSNFKHSFASPCGTFGVLSSCLCAGFWLGILESQLQIS